MGRYIIKPDKDVDFYVEWSTIVDNWVFAGNREDMVDEGLSEDRLDKADRLGSSYMLSCGKWEDKELIVCNLPDRYYEECFQGVEGYYTIPRENLYRFIMKTSDENSDTTGLKEMLTLNEFD